MYIFSLYSYTSFIAPCILWAENVNAADEKKNGKKKNMYKA